MSDSATQHSSADVRLEGVSKSFDGRTRAVDGVSLSIAAGEFFSLLGPSGCGKTTTLRMIAGFESPDEGHIYVGGAEITDVPVHKRNMGMIFQSYALFPHRTVAENVAFGLRMRGLGSADTAARVARALRQVALAGYEERRPSQLSGGQQQRVALARAIVVEPPVLLCDEPLGALDRKLRQQMQIELKQLQKELGVTLIFVTHDQEEAMTMSDRIAVMDQGKVHQIGTPSEIYNQPRTRFVADFIGDINLFEGESRGGHFHLREGQSFPANGNVPEGCGIVAIRPERLRLVAPSAGYLQATVESASFLGVHVVYRLRASDGRTLLLKQANAGFGSMDAGITVDVAWDPADMIGLSN